MAQIGELFDAYGRKARLLPALITLLPALLTMILLFTPNHASIAGGVTSLLIACGATYGLSHVSRYLGRITERALIKKWSGLPTTCRLRHRDVAIDSNTKQRYHKFLGAHLPGLRMPSAAKEQSDPDSADEIYRSAAKWLTDRTRDHKKFNLIFEENISYGFRRNSLGLKPVAMAILILSFVAAMGYGYATHRLDIENWPLSIWASIALDLVATAYWILVVAEPWVRDAGDAYAHALLGACDTLSESRA